MQVLSSRGEALENLVRRTGLASLRSITATLNQAIRFGTPLAESMRVLAAEMRNARLARLEERAARLPVLLTIPLVLFILPSLFMVIGTPVALRIMDALKNVFGKPFLNRGTRLDWACTGGRTMPFDGVKSIDQRVAARIRARRVRVGMTQQQLADGSASPFSRRTNTSAGSAASPPAASITSPPRCRRRSAISSPPRKAPRTADQQRRRRAMADDRTHSQSGACSPISRATSAASPPCWWR